MLVIKVLCCGWNQPMAQSVRAPASNLMCRPTLRCEMPRSCYQGASRQYGYTSQVALQAKKALTPFVNTQRLSVLWIILQKTINPEYVFIGNKKTRCIVKPCKILQLIRSNSPNVAPTMTRFECFVCLYINGKFTDRIAADKWGTAWESLPWPLRNHFPNDSFPRPLV